MDPVNFFFRQLSIFGTYIDLSVYETYIYPPCCLKWYGPPKLLTFHLYFFLSRSPNSSFQTNILSSTLEKPRPIKTNFVKLGTISAGHFLWTRTFWKKWTFLYMKKKEKSLLFVVKKIYYQYYDWISFQFSS